MNIRQVTCATKTDLTHDPHDCISRVGGAAWSLALDDAIAAIEEGKLGLFVRVAGSPDVRVVIATHLGRKYLKTEADGEMPNNLLSLRDCPSS